MSHRSQIVALRGPRSHPIKRRQRKARLCHAHLPRKRTVGERISRQQFTSPSRTLSDLISRLHSELVQLLTSIVYLRTFSSSSGNATGPHAILRRYTVLSVATALPHGPVLQRKARHGEKADKTGPKEIHLPRLRSRHEEHGLQPHHRNLRSEARGRLALDCAPPSCIKYPMYYEKDKVLLRKRAIATFA